MRGIDSPHTEGDRLVGSTFKFRARYKESWPMIYAFFGMRESTMDFRLPMDFPSME